MQLLTELITKVPSYIFMILVSKLVVVGLDLLLSLKNLSELDFLSIIYSGIKNGRSHLRTSPNIDDVFDIGRNVLSALVC